MLQIKDQITKGEGNRPKGMNMNESLSEEASADESVKDYMFSMAQSVKGTPTAKI